MPPNRKWLFLPPAVALLLVLGPLSLPANRTDPAASPAAPAAPAAAPAKTTDSDRAAPALPRTPDLWQLTSTLIGVLLFGGAGLFVLRRLRRGAKASGSGVVVLRQSLRLSGKQVLHAVEFDGRILLLGEGERGVHLLRAGSLAEQAADESAVAARRLPEPDADDDGAVPKNLVLPRPAPHRPVSPPRRTALGDFRALLAKAGR